MPRPELQERGALLQCEWRLQGERDANLDLFFCPPAPGELSGGANHLHRWEGHGPAQEVRANGHAGVGPVQQANAWTTFFRASWAPTTDAPGVTVHPCGQVMDYLRTAYRSRMIFRPGGPPLPIRWFRADNTAQFFRGENAFCSSTWFGESRQENVVVQPLGTVGEDQNEPRLYDKGANPIGYQGQTHCGSDDAWRGAPTEQDANIPLRPNGSSTCCGEAVVMAEAGA